MIYKLAASSCDEGEKEMATSSLASATGSNVESACKHIQPCKVHTDYMLSLQDGGVENAARELQTNKMKYCMHKDDIAIGLGRPLYGSSVNNSRKKAYPSVIVTLSGMEKFAQKWIALHYFLTQGFRDIHVMQKEFLDLVNKKPGDFNENSPQYHACKKLGLEGKEREKNRVSEQIKNCLDFYFVGISLGLAYAHPCSGDTVASVMIGGLKTILNGGFAVHTNDLLMWYWEEEEMLFEEDGRRFVLYVFNNVYVCTVCFTSLLAI